MTVIFYDNETRTEMWRTVDSTELVPVKGDVIRSERNMRNVIGGTHIVTTREFAYNANQLIVLHVYCDRYDLRAGS
jgi:hypothetical protein